MFTEIPVQKLFRKIQNCNLGQKTILFKFSGFHSSVNGVTVLLGRDTASLDIWFPIVQESIVVSKYQKSNTLSCRNTFQKT